MRRALLVFLTLFVAFSGIVVGCRNSSPPDATYTHPPQPTTTAPTPTTPAPTSSPVTPSVTTPAVPTVPTMTPPPVIVLPSFPRPTPIVPPVPPVPVPTTSHSPSGSGDSAASKLGWGTPNAGDEFNGSAVDSSVWGVYSGAGHVGNGRRLPSAFSVGDGVLTVTGLANGDTGGMAWHGGQARGRWEVRMRAPKGSDTYHPVLLLWPDAEDWPVGGEVDFAEIFDGDRDEANFFLHYGSSNSQTHGSVDVDATQWHNYAVELSGTCVTGWIDGVRWFQDCTPSHQPPRAMHPTVQLDWFPGDGDSSKSSMQVDYYRIWRL